jgi:transcriptional regulator with XRE-family HTH domain
MNQANANTQELRQATRDLRKRLGISQARLCHALGIAQSRYSLWEAGHADLSAESVSAANAYLTQELDALKSLHPMAVAQ